MKKLVGLAMLLAGSAGYMLAGNPTPEIDASSAVAAVTLLSGGLLVLRSRRRRM
jgi:MYXO-CTERM domain-containing protein